MAKSQFLTKILNRSDLDLRDGFSKKNIFPNNCVFLPSTGTLSDWKSTGSVAIFNLFHKLWILVSKFLKWGKLKSHIKTSFPIQIWKMQNCQKQYLINQETSCFCSDILTIKNYGGSDRNKNITENRIWMVSLCPDLIFWGQM
jgi:hypothetical protein